MGDYQKPDGNGHVTRLSDSSRFDEICVNCGAHDGIGLYFRCPAVPPLLYTQSDMNTRIAELEAERDAARAEGYRAGVEAAAIECDKFMKIKVMNQDDLVTVTVADELKSDILSLIQTDTGKGEGE